MADIATETAAKAASSGGIGFDSLTGGGSLDAGSSAGGNDSFSNAFNYKTGISTLQIAIVAVSIIAGLYVVRVMS